ncbi:lipoprotein [Catellatospora methionotrophica]|uniref:Lipoprotein n=1 Tax=Catellatospora methionotrophica TaxID=121620 RepID=A0A8J3PEW7_9ACTN|nr:fasciclin domain-containing protein [Catellatospora methionotrophica]GIG12581.1 lipoprotein [Catellatospora methionotrophica]
MLGKRRLTALAAAGTFAFTLALTACGNDTMATQPTATGSSAMAADEFGAGCAAVPKDPNNPGSFEAMAQQPVATAASGNPLLSTLVAAVKQAGLVDTLNNAEAVTVFAPTNDAFAKIPKADLDKVLADKATLTKILTYHVVAGKTAPDKLAGMHKTLEGQDLTVSGSGTDFKVNDSANVVCGNVQTRNATVYIVDSVLMPSS